MLGVDFVCYLSLSEFERHVLDCGKEEMHNDKSDGELHGDLSVVLTYHN